MSDVKISQLPAATTPLSGTELFPIVQGGVTKQVAVGGTIPASQILNTPAGTVAATTVQAAINEIVSDNAASSGSSLVGYLPSGTGAVPTTVQTKLRESVSVKDFGAVGDGVTNDNDAFAAASAYITSIGGGKLIIPPGTYIVGKQTFAGAFGQGYAYLPAPVISILNCTRPVVIEGNGATLKNAAGLRYGSFNPVTGAVYNPSMPFTNSDYKGQLYSGMIEAFGNSSITIRDIELDGNSSNLTLGGFWGDTGRQLEASGVYAKSNDSVTIENVYSHHHGLDGVYIGYDGLVETSPIYPNSLINIRSEYNGRQGLSWVGGTQLTAIACTFSNTGQGVLVSAPGAGVDIEASASICRNGLFLDCEMSNNSGPAMVADSGDSADIAFMRCKFIGQLARAIWPNKPRISFTDCLIVGNYVNSYASATVAADATKYTRCYFTDESKFAATLFSLGSLGSNLSDTGSQFNVSYDNCQFVTTRSRPGRFDYATLRGCTFNLYAGTNYVTNKDYVAIFTGTTAFNVVFNDYITVNPPVDGYYIGTTSLVSLGKSTVNSTGKVKWKSWSSGADGTVGDYQDTPPIFESFYLSRVNKAQHAWGVAAPTTETWTRGSVVWNITPSAGGIPGWVCVTAGTPGTWKAMAAVAA